jgi:virginiamycin B lyase
MTAFGEPTSITVGPDGNLWFTEYAAPGRIGKITTAGAITEVAVGGTTPGLPTNPQIAGIEPGPDGLLYFTEGRNNGHLARINSATAAVQDLATGGVSPGFSMNNGPEEIGLGADGNIWFAEVGNPNAAIGRITTSGVVTEFTGGLTVSSQPVSITPSPASDGNLWFTETKTGANAIGRLDTGTGGITEFSSGLSPNGSPRDIVPGPGGNVWLTEFNNPGHIAMVTPGGAISEVATGGITPGFGADTNPNGIAQGPDGALWFTEFHQPSGPAAVGRFDPSTGTVQEFPTPTTSSGPFQIVKGPDGNMWFTEFGAAKIARITTPPVAATTGASAVTATSAAITGTGDGHAQPTSFHIEYGPVGGATANTADQPLGTSAVAGSLNGLSPGTAYQARVVVSNPTGATAGNFVQFTTPTVAPAIHGARQSAKRWREGKKLARISRTRHLPVGTTFSFTLDQAAKVKLAFQAVHSCKRHRRKCKRLTGAGSLAVAGHPGTDKVRFQGRLSRHKRLKPGAYRLTITARNAAGQTSKPVRLRFTIVK